MKITIIKVSHLSGKSKMLLALTQSRIPISTKKNGPSSHQKN